MNGATQLSYHTPAAHTDTNGGHGVNRNGSHSQDASCSRGRVPAPLGTNSSILQAQHGGPAISPRSQSSIGSNRSPINFSGTIERRPSLTQNHYRHATKSQGPFAHSRNTSFVNSPTLTPLSPLLSPPVGLSEVPSFTAHQQASLTSRPIEPSSITGNLAQSSTVVQPADQEGTETSAAGVIKKRVERSGGNPTRRDHSHHRSKTKHQHTHEQKTVDEWTLTHLFTSVGHLNFHHNLSL